MGKIKDAFKKLTSRSTTPTATKQMSPASRAVLHTPQANTSAALQSQKQSGTMTSPQSAPATTSYNVKEAAAALKMSPAQLQRLNPKQVAAMLSKLSPAHSASGHTPAPTSPTSVSSRPPVKSAAATSHTTAGSASKLATLDDEIALPKKIVGIGPIATSKPKVDDGPPLKHKPDDIRKFRGAPQQHATVPTIRGVKLLPFNYKDALQGAPVATRDGRMVHGMRSSKAHKRRMLGHLEGEGEQVRTWFILTGENWWGESCRQLDLFMVAPLRTHATKKMLEGRR
jgi:hypothetical protein